MAWLQRLEYMLLNQMTLEGLLALEKERRGVERGKLVFLGMANVADYYWCAVRSVLESRAGELGFFASYLWDRIVYSVMLSYVNTDYVMDVVSRLPETGMKLLEVGDEITFDDVERLLKAADDIPETEAGEEIVDMEDPIVRGYHDHLKLAEQYPSIRWNFEWKGYVIVGVPDGITDEFVYEFKSTASRFLLNYIKPVAFAQADLYGYFFRRPRKRVQIYVREEGRIETWEESVSRRNAEELLERFRELDEKIGEKREKIGEELLALKPKPWKCKSCKYREVCVFSKPSLKAF